MVPSLWLSVAERSSAFVADPVPQRHGPLDFGACDQPGLVEFLGVEADRADVAAATGGFVALHKLWQRRATVAGHADGDAIERQPNGFLREEHERGSSALRSSHSDEEGDGDFLAIL